MNLPCMIGPHPARKTEMALVKFEIEAENALLVEVRVHPNNQDGFETVNFTNGRGFLNLSDGIFDVLVLMWGNKTTSAELTITTANPEDTYTFSGAISEGNRDLFSGEFLVGVLAALDVEP